MATYEIKNWNPVLLNTSPHPYPMLYISFDDKLKDYITHSDKVRVKITDSGTVYDGKEFDAVLSNSAFFPDYRPNFHDDTGYVGVTVKALWVGYPSANHGQGKVTILNIPKEDYGVIYGGGGHPIGGHMMSKDRKEDYTDEKIVENYACGSCSGMKNSQIGWVLVGLLVIFLALLLLDYSQRKKK